TGPVAGITANGYVVARTRASVSAKILGRLTELNVHEGSEVNKGDIIARIDAADFRAQLQLARSSGDRVKAELEQAQRALERARKLRADGFISAQELETIQTRVATLDAGGRESTAEVSLARANLENTVIRAPFDGTVLRKDAEVGEIVSPAGAGGVGALTRTAVVTMADLTTLEVEVDVNEAYIARIRQGQPAKIVLDAYPDASFKGEVRQVVPTADRQKATVQVKVSILEKDPRILPEMGAKVVFLEEEVTTGEGEAPRSRVIVPNDAVIKLSGGDAVWLVEDGRVRPKSIKIGARQGNDAIVSEGLFGGERVVLNPPENLEEGDPVRVAEDA
ncbi:efflux RND transporter periplasmic adaptor subunit, partial [bacterium]|nr:efflux RND transporter periplasmic adaptor subunit [bacterium]